jgi:hypothetical protein
MKSRQRRRIIAIGFGRRLDQRIIVQKPMYRNQRDGFILGEVLTMMESDRTQTTIKA